MEVVIQGYLQSWKYFKSFGHVIRRALAPSPGSKAKADDWLKQIRSKLELKNPGVKWKFVGVQVRRGDKVHNPMFAGVYFNADWGYFRTGMRLLEKKLRKTSGSKIKVAFVVTAGGSMASNNGDVAEAKSAL